MSRDITLSIQPRTDCPRLKIHSKYYKTSIYVQAFIIKDSVQKQILEIINYFILHQNDFTLVTFSLKVILISI